MNLGPVRGGAVATTVSALALAGLLLGGCQSHPAVGPSPSPAPPSPAVLPAGDGSVAGGIEACSGAGLPLPRKDRGFLPGAVTVLAGTVTWVPLSAGVTRAVLPAGKVASEELARHQGFQFVLPAGAYVLAVRSPRAGRFWTPLVIRPGRAAREDLAMDCL